MLDVRGSPMTFDGDAVDRAYESEMDRIGADLEQQAAIWMMRGALALGWLEATDED